MLEALLAKQMVPDQVIRWGIRRLLGQRLKEISAATPAEVRDHFLQVMRSSPIAVHTSDANEQHYQVPTEFYLKALGPNLKYSCGLWETGDNLARSEERMLELTCERAGLRDGMEILELGCGWGSLSLFMAERYPNSRITAISNSAPQRETIEAHPTVGAQLLRNLGVDDPLWLALVQDHHETLEGNGYPHQKSDLNVAQQILRMSDLFIARISPRTSRRGLWPKVVVGNLYLESQTRASPLGAYFVKQLCMYPPGSFVKLKTDEIGVVVRRGPRVNMPLVLAVTDPDGLLMTAPSRRDTQVPTYAIRSPVSPEDMRIRLDRSRLLKRV